MMHETHKQFAAELDVCAKAAVRIVPLPRPAAFSEPRPLERALSGVFVDHVQDYLDPGIVKPSDHLLEFGEGKIGHVRVAALRREERNRVVAPVVLPLLYRPPHARRRRTPNQAMESDASAYRSDSTTLRAWRSRMPAAPSAGTLALGLRQPGDLKRQIK
jgi:hypothetical protein